MPELSRTQVAVYGAIAVALLLVGAQAIRAEGGGSASGGETTWSDFGDGGGGEGGEEGEAGGEFELSGEAGDVVVDVTGAVQRPGVYRLPAGSRVTDAVERAGGAAPRAQLEAVNLAARLADGQQVVVPEAGPGGAGAAVGAVSEDGPISLGTATVEQLDTIDGIGPVTAEDIVEFRDEHGGLASVEARWLHQSRRRHQRQPRKRGPGHTLSKVPGPPNDCRRFYRTAQAVPAAEMAR